MGAVRTIQMTYHTDQFFWILITPGILKPFTENSSSLIFPWHPTDTSNPWQMPQGYYRRYGRVHGRKI